MQRVTGIGGVFFRTADPSKLAQWYAAHLGVDPPPESYDVSSWRQQGGPTVFAALPSDSDHFGGAAHGWAINFRVDDLAGMVDQLRAAGIDVDVDPETYPNGTFADLHDPEGNRVQLWQPAGADAEPPADPS